MCAQRHLPYLSSLGRTSNICCRSRVLKRHWDQDTKAPSSGVTELRLHREALIAAAQARLADAEARAQAS